MKRPSPLALSLVLFQMEAEAVAARFGITDVQTLSHTGTDCGTHFFCTYSHPGSLSTQLGLRPEKSPCAPTPPEAIRRLEEVLREKSPEFFSSN